MDLCLQTLKNEQLVTVSFPDAGGLGGVLLVQTTVQIVALQFPEAVMFVLLTQTVTQVWLEELPEGAGGVGMVLLVHTRVQVVLQ
jgi:hypothetical protein